MNGYNNQQTNMKTKKRKETKLRKGMLVVQEVERDGKTTINVSLENKAIRTTGRVGLFDAFMMMVEGMTQDKADDLNAGVEQMVEYDKRRRDLADKYAIELYELAQVATEMKAKLNNVRKVAAAIKVEGTAHTPTSQKWIKKQLIEAIK